MLWPTELYGFYYGSAVVYNNEIHILGGNGGSKKHYKWNGSSWSEVSTLPYNFNSSCAVVYNNEIHIMGGSNNTNHYKWDGTNWTSVSTLPYICYNGARAVVYNNEIHIMGGNYGKTRHYKWNGTSWSSVSTLPYEFSLGSAVTVYNDVMHIMLNTTTIPIDNTHHYKWNGTSWIKATNYCTNLSATDMLIYDNNICVICILSTITNYPSANIVLTASEYQRSLTHPYEDFAHFEQFKFEYFNKLN